MADLQLIRDDFRLSKVFVRGALSCKVRLTIWGGPNETDITFTPQMQQNCITYAELEFASIVSALRNQVRNRRRAKTNTELSYTRNAADIFHALPMRYSCVVFVDVTVLGSCDKKFLNDWLQRYIHLYVQKLDLEIQKIAGAVVSE